MAHLIYKYAREGKTTDSLTPPKVPGTLTPLSEREGEIQVMVGNGQQTPFAYGTKGDNGQRMTDDRLPGGSL